MDVDVKCSKDGRQKIYIRIKIREGVCLERPVNFGKKNKWYNLLITYELKEIPQE